MLVRVLSYKQAIRINYSVLSVFPTASLTSSGIQPSFIFVVLSLHWYFEFKTSQKNLKLRTFIPSLSISHFTLRLC